ncbi:MAG: hypothetical protein MZU84_04220 [Sphingobacterium sp.]|nr:hypothetical protein [Sphingobacterium sp.]
MAFGIVTLLFARLIAPAAVQPGEARALRVRHRDAAATPATATASATSWWRCCSSIFDVETVFLYPVGRHRGRTGAGSASSRWSSSSSSSSSGYFYAWRRGRPRVGVGGER